MRVLSSVLGLILLAGGASSERVLEQVSVTTPGFVEIHTPGSGDAAAFPVGETLSKLLGPEPDLNQVSTLRTRLRPPGLARKARARPGTAPPRIVMILIPGFLGGAATFDPMARDLVQAFRGQLEVWAVDRRSNQLEDRRGALHARAATRQALQEGVRFYFDPVDLDDDQQPDPPFELPDASGGSSAFLRPSQDDARFLAHWGVDAFARDWRLLVDEARALVGKQGLVLFGGHSMGTSWAGVFAAYDFDPGPGVLAGHELVDGLVLLEGGGPDAPDADAPDRAAYLEAIDALAGQGGPPVYLDSLFGIVDPVELGAAGELNGVAGRFFPTEPAILQETDLFGGFPLSLLLGAPFTNRSVVGFFLDDDFTPIAIFGVSMGFSDNAPNVFNPFAALIPGDFYVADPTLDVRRTWKSFDDPGLPTCPPNDPEPGLGASGVGCALIDHGPSPAPDAPPARWGLEREVTDPEVLLRLLYETSNASEWYFVSGRVFLDFSFGRDSSALGDESLLAVTRNAEVDVPVLGIGGSNGLAPTEASFADYYDSIATPDEHKQVAILEGYSHLDVLSATDNEAVPVLADWIQGLRRNGHGRGPR
jgi:hypothetical protein